MGSTQAHFVNQGVELLNEDVNNALAAQIMSYKRTGNLFNSLFVTNTSSPLKTGEQETQYYLMNTFNAFNLVLVEPPPICEEKDNYLLVDDALQVATWVGDQQTETAQDTNSDPTINLNPLPFLTSLASGFTVNAALSPTENLIPSTFEREENEGSFDVSLLDPGSLNNIFGRNHVPEISNLDIISAMPPQLTSVVASYAGSTDIKYDWSQISIAPATITSFVFNYLLLQGVEFLTGYDITYENDKILIKHPIWESATLDKLKAFGSNEVFCRLKKYDNEIIPSVSAGEGLDLPAYNDYFIVKNIV
jgi:hypothetical protein